jgi:transcriptional regulator, AsnC family
MKSKAPTIELDRYDRRILEELQRDGGLSNQRLAERIGLSPSPCLRRVQALEEAGIIRKRVALLDPQRLGLALMVLMHISMDRHTPERLSILRQKSVARRRYWSATSSPAMTRITRSRLPCVIWRIFRSFYSIA